MNPFEYNQTNIYYYPPDIHGFLIQIEYNSFSLVPNSQKYKIIVEIFLTKDILLYSY